MKPIDITKEILPSELDSLFDTAEYENYRIFIIDNVSFENNFVEFYFTVKISEGLLDEEEENYQWKLKITSCKDYHIEDSNNIEAFITIFSDHILLSHYRKNWKELYFKNYGENLEKLFVEFHNLHSFTLDNFILPAKYIMSENLEQLLRHQNALFARGPEDVLDLYFNLLLKYGKQPYYFQSVKKPEAETNTSLKIVFLGNNYFIGEQLEFQKL
jgi:hypothetical protein